MPDLDQGTLLDRAKAWSDAARLRFTHFAGRADLAELETVGGEGHR